MRKLLVVLLLLAPAAFARTRTVRQIVNPWQQPACTQISGLGFVRFIDANGDVRESVTEPQGPFFGQINTTEALAAGATPNVLWAVTWDGEIAQSADAGCTWSVRARVPEALGGKLAPRIIAADATHTYVYTPQHAVRLTQGTVETFAFPKAIANLAIDPKNALHGRAIAKSGEVYESNDGAATWTYIGRITWNTVISAATDPSNFEHVIAGTGSGCTPLSVCAFGKMLASNDGGKTWTKSGIEDAAARDIQFSPADPAVLWADVWNTHSAALFRSTDGGQTFAYVTGNANAVWFTHGTLAPHPTDPNRVAIAFRGAEVYTSLGKESEVFVDNVRQVVWSPAGTLYYVVQVVQLR